MSKTQKRIVESRARAARRGIGAYMHQQALGEADEDVVLVALAQELEASNARAVHALNDTIARIEGTKRQWPELEAAARRRAVAEFADLSKARQP